MRKTLIRVFAVGVVPALMAVAAFQVAPLSAAQDQVLKGAQSAESAQAAESGGVGTEMYIEGTGCPVGAVCIYPNASWNYARPSHVYWSYGYHNLRNQYGVHRIYNNQTGGATMRTCLGYNGTRCEGYLPAGRYIDKNLTPINSITLQP